MKFVWTLLIILFCVSIANAQQAAQNMHFAFDQPAPDLASAQGYTYKYYPDNATTGINFANVACTGSASPFNCLVLIPSFTPGNHSITLTASNVAGESVKSNPFTFAFVVTPAVMTNIRIVP